MRKSDDFIITTSILAAVIAGLYLFQVITEGFTIAGWLIIAANFIYTIGSILLGRKFFIPWSIIYSLVLVYTVSYTETLLFNNFTPLFAMFFVIMLLPQYKWILVVVYITAAAVALLLQKRQHSILLRMLLELHGFFILQII